MTTSIPSYPREYRVHVPPQLIRSIKDPHNDRISIVHAYVRVADFKYSGQLPDKINPRAHEQIKGSVPQKIEDSIKSNSDTFHLLNRGVLALAQKAWYDNKTEILHIVIDSEDVGGLADGATTDRVIAKAKEGVAAADFEALASQEVPEHLKTAYFHLEVISGDIENILLPLTEARNTSNQVQAFSMEDLGKGYDWLKACLQDSEFKDKIRYRENDMQPVDVRKILGLLMLFHPDWRADKKSEMGRKDPEPVIAYTSKGTVLENYRKPEWKKGFEQLEPVACDIFRLYDHIHVEFQKQYQKAHGAGTRLGLKKEVKYKNGQVHTLLLSGKKTEYLIQDGWLYPMLASMRVLLKWPKNGNGKVQWIMDPFKFFDENGHLLIADLVEQSESLGRNPQTVGKTRSVWAMLRLRAASLLTESLIDAQ